MGDPAETLVLENTGRLLEYLAAVAREVQSRPVRDFTKFEPVLLPESIPGHSRVRVGPREGDPAWLVVPRLQEPRMPTLPSELEGFVDVLSLEDLDGIPRLDPTFLDDSGELAALLDEWVEDNWLAWSFRVRPIREARVLYQQVLELRLLAQRQQATHEVIWGFSVIGVPRAGRIVAPLLITRVQIELDEVTGTLSVVPETSPELELDPLEGISLEGMEDLALLRAQVVTGEPVDPWIPESLDSINKRIVAPLGVDAACSEAVELPLGASGPTVTRGWMLLSRPRPARHQRFYDELAEVLKEREFLPEALASVVAPEAELDRTLQTLQQPGAGDWQPVADRLLMPLPANDEQARIVRQLSASRGVTVQGPPGTGKSHTIVNLVCHLMAHGKRVLVTAQNEQALGVLREKFPAELRDLTVSVLGSSPQHMDSVRASIQAVLDISSRVDPKAQGKEIDELHRQLDATREELSLTDKQLVDALRSEEAEFSLAEGKAKAAEVARWLREMAPTLDRIPDSVPADQSCPLAPVEFTELTDLLQALDRSDILEFERRRPRSVDLPTAGELRDRWTRLTELLDRVADLEEAGLDIDRVATLTPEELDAAAGRIREASKRLSTVKSTWAWPAAVASLQNDEDLSYWSLLSSKAHELLGMAQEVKRRQLGRDVTLPVGDRRIQRMLLSELKERFLAGKGVPRVFNSDLRTFHSSCRIDGLEPRTADEIELLESELALRQYEAELQQLIRQASEIVALELPEVGARFLVAATSIIAELDAAMAWATVGDPEVRDLLASNFEGDWDHQEPDVLDRAFEMLSAASAQREAKAIQGGLKELDARLVKESEGESASGVWVALRNSLSRRDWAAWQDDLAEADRIESLGSQIRRLEDLQERLERSAPLWAHALRVSEGSREVSGQPDLILEMWTWRQAATWLERLHAGPAVEGLMDKAAELQRKIERLVVRISRLSAEVAVKDSLDGEKRKALTAWQQALQRYGKGTGKNAATYLQVARSQLPVAMGAIPAWIMPVHRVIDNFDPRLSELFDVVIVDESSQCDLLSVGVLALGRKCVVVGDDKQTSPAAVGVDTLRIRQLQDSYLSGVDLRQLLTADESLYGLSERVFPSVILLREHFRCLPEIIRFSNRYYDNRILPLREPPDYDIGDPLRAVFVADGVRSGSSSNAVNSAEAERLVQQVLECHEDPRYEGLTFGVVTLLGNQQAPLIEKMLIERLGFEAFEERDLRVGSPAAFQGDERNVVFISVVADGGSYAAVKTADKQRINVAASRAQDQMWVFYSMDPGVLHHEDQRRALIEYALDGGKILIPERNQLEACESGFEKDVLRDIVARGFEVVPQYPVGHYRIDLVVDTGVGRIAVECDGDSFHGAEQFEHDLRRQRVLERLGWEFWRVRASEYYRDPGRAMRGLWARLDELGRATTATKAVTQSDSLVTAEQGPPRVQWREVMDDGDALFQDVNEHREDSLDLAWAADELALSGDEPTDAALLEIEMESLDSPKRQSPVSQPSGTGLPSVAAPRLSKHDPSGSESIPTPGGDFYPFGKRGNDGLSIHADTTEQIEGPSMAARRDARAEESLGILTRCTFRLGPTVVDFHVIEWDDGSGEVECDDMIRAGIALRRLLHGGRVGFYPTSEGTKFAELRIMRQGQKGFPTAHNPLEDEFDQVLEWDLEEALVSIVGADRVGTRGEIIGDKSGRRGTPAVAWTRPGVDVPAFVYVATRILPLMVMDGDY